MQIDRRKLGKHVASLSDEELLNTKWEDLTDVAQRIYDLEIAHRGLDRASTTRRIETTEASLDAGDYQTEASFGADDYQDDGETSDPDWHQSGVVVCGIMDQPGEDAADRISKAQMALQAAGIPSHLSVKRESREAHALSAYPRDHYDVMEILVPVRYAMHAHGIMDRDVFNDEFETHWRDHLGLLSSEDLLALDPEIFCIGLLDKIARMKRVYAEEMAKRNLKARGI
ncbi:MAG: hypothetical protein JXA73_00520 [Acidobacteria bacterium]|nr:hypothetical protein [Acidobacteriota bacterium]